MTCLNNCGSVAALVYGDADVRTRRQLVNGSYERLRVWSSYKRGEKACVIVQHYENAQGPSADG